MKKIAFGSYLLKEIFEMCKRLNLVTYQPYFVKILFVNQSQKSSFFCILVTMRNIIEKKLVCSLFKQFCTDNNPSKRIEGNLK